MTQHQPDELTTPAPKPDEPTFNEAPAKNVYEVHFGDALAGFAEYRREGDVTTFTHTEIGDAFDGQGLGSRLVRFALDTERASGHTVVPRCGFVKTWIEKHPEYADLVA